MGESIIAMPVPTITGGADMDVARCAALKGAQTRSNWHAINNYPSPFRLIHLVKSQLDHDPWPCLSVLCIVTHGSPLMANGINSQNAALWARSYKYFLWVQDQKLCDETHIILNGCNTGLRDLSGADSIAKQIANAIPFDRNNFPIHVTVWGSRGYIKQGTDAMQGNTIVTGGRIGGLVSYPGSTNARGQAAWIKFRNWR